ncbi:MAG: Gfo/Idh/MocA family oxidoreductase [Lentisphaeria bacterium]|nr:Gfo/Idh/MocA family oxidoreductase [Lentisphaeria bacterium]
MEARFGRRRFLRTAAVGAAGCLIAPRARSEEAAGTGGRVNVALVGVGGRGSWFVDCMPGLANVVALCDVSDKKATRAYERFPDLPRYHDYRVMLDEMGERIEAVVVAVPDHNHAPASLAAMQRGRHVLCEKPLARTVREARRMRDMAKAAGVATQMGNQGTASGAYRRGVELIQAGAIGDVTEVYVWKDGGGPGWREVPTGEADVPYYLKWDLWLGPRPWRPFHPRWMAWHGWRDFGTCELGNWASHSANLAFRALKIDTLWYADPATAPRITVQARVESVNRLSFPRWEVIEFRVPSRGELPPLTLTWVNGSNAPGWRARIEEMLGRRLDWGDAGERKWHDHAGTLIVGTEGRMVANGHNTTIQLLPAERFEDLQVQKPETLPSSRGHEREWLEACRGGPPGWSHFDYAGPLAEFLMLGNVASQFEGPIEFDPLACRVLNNTRADDALSPHDQEDWHL